MNLTDEQIEAAAKAMYCTEEMVTTVGPEHALSWERARIDKDGFRKMARAAAPFLQMPWEMPTEEETNDVYREVSRTGSFSVPAVTRIFVRRRNASLTPKPVDPRRDKIVYAIKNGTNPIVSNDAAALLADRILAALDAKE